MSGAEVLAVVSCVAAIISAYRDGSALIKDIRARRLERRLAQENNATEHLESSLKHGSLVVQEQYDHDFRRFGEQYAQGDHIAREQLKDIIINLQMALLTNLRVSLASGVQLEMDVLLISSDNSRVDAVMALCQLYQRMAQVKPVHRALAGPNPSQPDRVITSTATHLRHFNEAPPSPTSLSSSSNRLSYANSISSASSAFLSLNDSQPEGASVRQTWHHSFDQSGSRVGNQARLSSASLPPIENPARLSSASLFPTFPQPHRKKGLFSGLRHLSSSRHSAPYPIKPVNETWEEGSTKRDADRIPNSLAAAKDEPPWPRPSNQSTAGHEHPSQNEPNPWVEPDEDDTAPAPVQPPHHTNPYDPDGWGNVYRAEEQGSSADSPTRPPSPTASGYPSRSSTSSMGVQLPPSVSTMLFLPSETNGFAGFCKGAWKLQLGLKKAFSISMRPAGLFDHIPFWQCSKCSYEGPVQGGEARSSWGYDQRIHIHRSTGIRYRWLFLAKSHISSRNWPAGRCDSSVGCFGCIFCSAEQRGPAPVFYTLATFMEHLQTHSQRPIASGLLDRTRCIAGRVASNTEDFDLNIPS